MSCNEWQLNVPYLFNNISERSIGMMQVSYIIVLSALATAGSNSIRKDAMVPCWCCAAAAAVVEAAMKQFHKKLDLKPTPTFATLSGYVWSGIHEYNKREGG